MEKPDGMKFPPSLAHAIA